VSERLQFNGEDERTNNGIAARPRHDCTVPNLHVIHVTFRVPSPRS
jgi:hypothetical protein